MTQQSFRHARTQSAVGQLLIERFHGPDLAPVLEKQFGSDEALGVRFESACTSGLFYTAGEVDALYAKLGAAGMPDILSVFPDGTSATCCTEYAQQVANAYPGRTEIVGFANSENPTARVVIDQLHPGGHDFAILDGRWLIDPWIRLVAAANDKIVFDLLDPDELRQATEWYGPRQCWLTVRYLT